MFDASHINLIQLGFYTNSKYLQLKKYKETKFKKKKQSVMRKISYFIIISIVSLLYSCSIKTAEEVDLHFSTKKSKIPSTLNWKKIGFAKELINQNDMIVFISGGKNPIPLDKWDAFKPSFPYRKNVDRHILFQKTAFYRSPDTDINCKEVNCIKQREYKNYTWVEMAKLICVDFVGGETDMSKPEKGHLVLITIQKCQTIIFTDTIFQLTDNKGNYYVMHATETGKPDLSAALPNGWSLKKVMLKEPLIISPFGGGNECYYNIVRDNLGQGYHQYIFSDAIYPSNKK